jgi:hypothetical protein
MAQHVTLVLFVLAQTMIVIHDFNDGLAGIRATNPNVHLSVERDPEISNQRVLLVEYPAPTGDPAARDVMCTAKDQDWTGGRAIAFQVKPANSMRISVSFVDRNQVAYTAWRDLKGGVWQPVRIGFDEIRPNPFFQPPGAKTGAPLDVSDVKAILFAPQDPASGRMSISLFVVSN